MSQADENQIIPFQLGDTAVRGRVVRLGSAIDEILTAHQYPDGVSELVGQAAVLVALTGASLKFDGKLILQVRGEGAVKMIIADYTAGGALRAMATVEEGTSPSRGGVRDLLGKGYFMMTVDQGADMDRYQGVTPLEGDSFAEAAISYFNQSEQLPTAAFFTVGRLSRPGATDVWRAGGIIAQFVPAEGGARERGEDILRSAEDADIWDRAAALLNTTQADELLDPELDAKTLLYRLFHEDGVRVFDPQSVTAKCSCDSDKIGAVLARYSPAELEGMVEDGAISVTCEFCHRTYQFDASGKELVN